MSKAHSLIVNLLWDIISYLYLRKKGVSTKFRYVSLQGGLPYIFRFPGSKIIIDKGVTLISHTKYNNAGINHPVILTTASKDAIIHLKQGSGASGATMVSVDKIVLGNQSGLGVNACVYDTDFHLVDPVARKNQKSILEAKSAPVIIGDNVWVAANCIILKGTTIGNNTIVGAGSVVVKPLAANSIYAGNPALKIKDI